MWAMQIWTWSTMWFCYPMSIWLVLVSACFHRMNMLNQHLLSVGERGHLLELRLQCISAPLSGSWTQDKTLLRAKNLDEYTTVFRQKVMSRQQTRAKTAGPQCSLHILQKELLCIDRLSLSHTHTFQCVDILHSYFQQAHLRLSLCLQFYPIRSSEGQLDLRQLGFSSGVRWNLAPGLSPATSISHTNTHTHARTHLPSTYHFEHKIFLETHTLYIAIQCSNAPATKCCREKIHHRWDSMTLRDITGSEGSEWCAGRAEMKERDDWKTKHKQYYIHAFACPKINWILFTSLQPSRTDANTVCVQHLCHFIKQSPRYKNIQWLEKIHKNEIYRHFYIKKNIRKCYCIRCKLSNQVSSANKWCQTFSQN